MWRLAMLVFAGGATAGASQASAVAVFAEAGLLGTWSPDCRQPPSARNPRVTWQADGGTVTHTVSIDGVTVALRDYVGTAERLGAGQVRFTAVRDGRVALTVTIMLQDDRVHTLRSVGADGRLYYDKGIDLQTRQPALSDERCAPAIS